MPRRRSREPAPLGHIAAYDYYETVTQSTGSIRVSDRGGSRWVVIDNPAARNAYDQEMATRLAEVIEASTDVRSVVMTGSPGAFCAGGMLAGLSAPTQHGMRELYRSSLRLFDACLLYTSPSPRD